MPIDKKIQCKTTYQDYLLYQSRQFLAQLTPEAKQRLAERIQARIVLGGEQPVNQELCKQVMNKLKGGNGNGK